MLRPSSPPAPAHRLGCRLFPWAGVLTWRLRPPASACCRRSGPSADWWSPARRSGYITYPTAPSTWAAGPTRGGNSLFHPQFLIHQADYVDPTRRVARAAPHYGAGTRTGLWRVGARRTSQCQACDLGNKPQALRCKSTNVQRQHPSAGPHLHPTRIFSRAGILLFPRH